MDLLRLPRRHQGDERRRDVGGPRLDVPRHLHRARSRREDADRGRSAGAHRPVRDQAAHRPLPAHARIRRALLGRPVLGDRVHRRHGARRAHARHALELPHAADAHEPRAGARAQPDRPLVEESAGGLQAPLHRHEPRHLVAAVRERRPDAAEVRRRLRHRVLRLGDAPGQADAVLRRAGQPRQVPALRDQRRARRDERRPGRAGRIAR